MKKFSLLVLLICSTLVFGQSRVVSQKVQSLNTMKQQFSSYQMFTKNNDTGKSMKYNSSATDVTVLNLNTAELSRMMSEAPNYISLAIPYMNESIEVQLYKQDVLTDTFFATDESGNAINYTPGKYYRGIVNGDYTSIAAISFFENEIMGVISTAEKGNIVLGKSMDNQDYISYSDENLLGQNPYVCGVDAIDYNQQIQDQMNFDPSVQNSPESVNCVKIYYEIAYRPFQLRGNSVQNTLDWITGIQNNIGTLYNNDDINMALNQVKIWTYQDPYTGDYSENLYLFQSTVKDFDADLAHLVNNPSTTSVAFLNSLCTDYNYAYSGISMSYAEVPTYSWTIMAMTHEMGHSLGSPHTHACAWNGNNTAIDGCGPAAGYGEGCNAPLPTNGGTIMSYCHLTSAGINLSLGFGPQPSQLIRNTIDSKPCLGTDCIENPDVCTYAIQKLGINYLNNGNAEITITDPYSSSWKYQTVPYGATPTNNWTDVSNTTFTVSGIPVHTFYELYVINICADGTAGSMKKTVLLFGDFCDGTLFTDTGGETANYGNNEHWTKTFYPSSNGEKVSLNFARIGLQTGSDYMYIYDGDNINSPLFTGGTINGNNNPGPNFQSTHATGAITVEFKSDGSGVAYGWEATINCSSLGVEDVSDSFGISVYPNPATDVLNISSQKTQILSASLTDVVGRKVLSTKIEAQNGQINVSHLPKGVYILTLKTKDQTITKKIIKK